MCTHCIWKETFLSSPLVSGNPSPPPAPLLPYDWTYWKLNNTYLPCCGPTLPMSCALLAVIWKSAIAPDSIPNGLLQFPENSRKYGKFVKTEWILNEVQVMLSHSWSLGDMRYSPRPLSSPNPHRLFFGNGKGHRRPSSVSATTRTRF